MTLARLATSTLGKEPSPIEQQPRRRDARTARQTGRLLAVSLILAGYLVAAPASPAAALSPAQRGEAALTPGHMAPPVPGVVRLHVVGHSDRPEDQALKLAVRNAVLARFGNELASLSDRASLTGWVAAHKASVESLATRVLSDGGAPYGARLSVGTYAFPETRFGPLVFPAGQYRALLLILGDGAGHNWWCVLFPPLCVVNDEQVTEVEARPADLAVPALNPLDAIPPVTTRGPVEWRWSFLKQEDGTSPQPPLYLARWWNVAQRLLADGTARLLGQPARAGAPDDKAAPADPPASD